MARNGKETAAILRTSSRKTVVLEHATARARADGLIGEDESITATFGRIDPLEAAKHGALIAAIRRKRQEAEEAGAEGDGERTLTMPEGGDKAALLLLRLSMISPRFWDGPPDECPDGWITPADLADDFTPLLEAVSTFMGISREAAEKAASFRR